MPFPDIQLDDRNFERLVADARRRIPGYTPEWTDLNDSDPGITLVQLFAWLEEMILWRLNRVPEKNYIEFLKLIGIEREPPAPAKTELTFYLATSGQQSAADSSPGSDPLVLTIPQCTKVHTTEADADGPVIFETDKELNVVAARLRTLQSFDGAIFLQCLDLSNGVSEPFFYPFGFQPQAAAAFYLGFDRSFPPSPNSRPYTLTVHAFTDDLIESSHGISSDSEVSPAPVDAVWEYWAGHARKWLPLRITDDTTVGLTRSGIVVFEGPVGAETTKLGLLQKPEDKPLFWFRYRIEQVLGTGYETTPRLKEILINTVGASNLATINGEHLGASDGSPNQKFRFSKRPVLLDGLTVEVNEGNGPQPWERVTDFANATRTSRVFTLDAAIGEIAFGDGQHGKIPARLTEPGRPEEDLQNIKALKYRWGGGARGNVGANKVTSPEQQIPYLDKVTNLSPAVGGQDEESVEEAKNRAPRSIRTQSRAVTRDDFEFLALQTPGARIRRARALSQHNPTLEPIRPAGVQARSQPIPAVPGAVTVIVVPDSLSSKPVPSESTCAAVASWLDQHRLVTSELYVAAPRYREVRVVARIIVEKNAISSQVVKLLKSRLLAYFHPLTGGTDASGWEFGGCIYFSDTYRLILETPGVSRLEVKDITTYVDGLLVEPATDVLLESNEVVFSETHQVFASYA
jgi:predicted phage baseplate assembly protein